MLELALCCTSQWTWASAFSPLSFFLLPFLPSSSPLFVCSSGEMKMIIAHYASIKNKKKANESVKGTSQFHNLVPLKPCVIHLQVSDYECLYFSTHTSIQGAMWHCCLIPLYICMHMHLC